MGRAPDAAKDPLTGEPTPAPEVEPANSPLNTPGAAAKIQEIYGKYYSSLELYATDLNKFAGWTASVDIDPVPSGDDEEQYVASVSNFFQKLDQDHQAANSLVNLDRMNGYASEMEKHKKELDKIAKDFGWNDADMKAALGSKFDEGLLRTAQEKVSNALGDMGKTWGNYGERMEAAADTMLKNWDQSKHNEKTTAIMNSITGFLTMAGGLAFGGGAIATFWQKGWAGLNGIDRTTNAGGLVFLGSATWSTVRSNLPKPVGEMHQYGGRLEGKMEQLVQKFNKWVADFKDENEKRDRTPPFVA